MNLFLWKETLWSEDGHAYCPEHRIKLDVMPSLNRGGTRTMSQDTPGGLPHICLVCPEDNRRFELPNRSFPTLRRRFVASLESMDLKSAKIVSLDGYQIPIAKARTEEDPDYWVEARINDTERGKQLVVYAGKRGDRDKAQIFIDTENDKIAFDQNNIHPSDVFVRLTGEFASGKKTTMEDGSEEH